MGKIKKDTTKYLKSCNSLKIFKYEKSNKYYSCFYVGSNASSSGNKIQSLKTENINDAMKKAKENYHKWFELNKDNLVERTFDFTKEKEIILDPFMGLGTTGISCVSMNRDFIGIELIKEYYDISGHNIQETSKS